MSHVTRFGNGTREENCSSDRFSFKNCPLHINYSTVLNGSLVFVRLCQRNTRYAIMKSALALPTALPIARQRGSKGQLFSESMFQMKGVCGSFQLRWLEFPDPPQTGHG